MKNLLNCHSPNLNSFPIKYENGLYRRVFHANTLHLLWKPFEIAIHPHHVNIKITVLEGELYNPLYKVNRDGESFNAYKYQSAILNQSGKFEYLGQEKLSQISNNKYKKGESFSMTNDELHTIQIEKGKLCVWLVEESEPFYPYLPINYSPNDLSTWSDKGLYIETGDTLKEFFIGKYLPFL